MNHSASRFALCCAAAASLTVGSVVGQCGFTSVSMSSTGGGCNTVFASLPTLSGSLNGSACSLDLTVAAFPGCCNTFLSGRVFALGFQQTNQPLPMIGANCTLWVQPDAVVFLPTTAGDTLTLQLPPGLQPPITMFAQGAAIYFTTIGLTNDAELTGGQSVVLQ